jgi:hypothetical protein
MAEAAAPARGLCSLRGAIGLSGLAPVAYVASQRSRALIDVLGSGVRPARLLAYISASAASSGAAGVFASSG